MRDAAMDLPVDDQRIDQGAGILQRDIAQDAHLAGLDIDLDLGGVARIGVGERVGAEMAGSCSPGSMPGGNA